MTKIYHIGLPATHPSVPEEFKSKLMPMLEKTQESMRADGFDYTLYLFGEDGFSKFEEELKTANLDGVVIGGGLKMLPAAVDLLEKCVNAVRIISPKTAIIFINTPAPEDVKASVARWFKN
eukprot:TRINITY_DN4881_c0_g1_i1.p1 TRINITY_DN4881_c0_g1~~TRINITY_DN4881_c0_g1_i1.p1  ORF type:complete len:121 (-),score=28.88 TRINITY_DN4881_c0_g1_i1:42-404(-)